MESVCGSAFLSGTLDTLFSRLGPRHNNCPVPSDDSRGLGFYLLNSEYANAVIAGIHVLLSLPHTKSDSRFTCHATLVR